MYSSHFTKTPTEVVLIFQFTSYFLQLSQSWISFPSHVHITSCPKCQFIKRRKKILEKYQIPANLYFRILYVDRSIVSLSLGIY